MILKFHRRRILLFFIVVLAVHSLLLARMYSVQVLQRHAWREKMEAAQFRSKKVWRKRGTVFDAYGTPLAFSYTTWSLIANPTKVLDKQGTTDILATILGMNDQERADLSEKLNRDKQFVYIRRKLEPAVAASIRGLKLKGLRFEQEFKRFYPNPKLASNVIGIVGTDNKGLAGVEYSYDDQLRGLAGETLSFSGLRGLEIPKSNLVVSQPRGGHHVYLTIDSGIQQIADYAVEKLMADHQPTNCFVLIVDPMTGEILACSMRPTFDLSSFAGYSRDIAKARNLAISHIFEPGSTFKVLTIASALEDERITPTTPFYCPGFLSLYDIKIGCTGKHGHLSATEVMVRSCNVGAMSTGIVMGPRSMYYYMRKFGLGEKTGIELPGEASGILRLPRKWSGLSIGAISMGQEIGVTGLQMAMAVSTIVNGGKLLKPTLIKRITSHDNRKVLYQATPRVRHQVISPETAEKVKAMMAAVVLRGTGKNARSDLYIAGGKTGTSQKLGKGSTRTDDIKTVYNEKVVTSFVGFFPYDNPRYLVYIMANEPQSYRPMGGKVAAPVFKDIATRITWYENLVPSTVRNAQYPAISRAARAPDNQRIEMPEWSSTRSPDPEPPAEAPSSPSPFAPEATATDPAVPEQRSLRERVRELIQRRRDARAAESETRPAGQQENRSTSQSTLRFDLPGRDQ